ncbi:MAG: aspartate 1-decarboxylase [Planctomycetota bacterium]|nr:aspartate 1-decarboxylase [Planctomycetota bacterium]
MQRTMLRAKIHHARITQCDPEYVGSITIDADLLRAVDLRPNEAVHVLDVDNAARFETYVIRGEPGTGIIGINGPASKLVEKGHRIIVLAFALIEESKLDEHEANIVIADTHNRVARQFRLSSVIDTLAPTR